MIRRYVRDRIVHSIEDRTVTSLLVSIFGLSWIYETVRDRLERHRRSTQIRYDLEQDIAEKTTN